MILETIKQPNDIHKVALADFPALAEEIRAFLLQTVSQTGGHLASNLGAVELTLALHNVLQFPEDKIIWDVGHQAYTHKILTGRKDDFDSLRQEGGLSGFPKRSESPCDSFDTGHSSTSISAGLGYVKARDLLGESYHVVSVIGDGALTGGMAYEAMNNAAELKTNFIIVLNDNNMSISPNVGGISTYLSDLRTAQAYTSLKLKVTKSLKKIPKVGEHMVSALRNTKSSIKQLVIPGMLFENMGLTYLGPADGHDMRQMMKLFNEAKRVQGPVLVHVLTEKGRGYEPAKRHPARFHGTTAFDIETGHPLAKQEKPAYTDVFAKTLCQLGDREPKLAAITAAMPSGTGLKSFGKKHPDRFFDVGIAEQHAVTFAAGLALGGMVPVVAVYSSFLQRAFDQILHDVCMQKLHVVFAVDRAGLVGSDGETHQGCFDLSYLSMMPGMTVMAPKNGWELSEMLKYAVKAVGPVAVRYPRGSIYEGLKEHKETVIEGRSELIHQGEKTAYLAVGSMVQTAEEIHRQEQAAGRQVTVVNARFVKPLDTNMLDYLAKSHTTLVTMEENVISGGFGEQVLAYMSEHHPHVRVIIAALPDQFVEQGNVDVMKEKLGLDAGSIRRRVYDSQKAKKPVA
ncbi:MAG: 1-deoxy-D-xylulose-5-phosphate synthase [Blautia sp.]|jgi:1-deoxy-D-xylulose-5-phosphate synthase